VKTKLIAAVLSIPFLFPPASAQDRLYRFEVDQDRAGGAVDFSHLNKPLTPASAISVRGEHFRDAAGARVRFMGLNLCFAANFPEEKDAARIAKRLRKLGVNLVRLHHMDTSPDADPEAARSILTTGPYPTLNPVSVARLRHFLDALKAEGIYINLNLHVGYAFRPEVDKVPAMPEGRPIPTHSKPLHIFHPRMVELQLKFTRDVIGALKLNGDPVLAMVEINNETSLAYAWQTGQLQKTALGEYQAELDRQWRAWLGAHRGGRTGDETNDYLRFLVHTDRQYLRAMRDAVRATAGAKVPIAGTQMDFGGLLILDSHDVLDYHDAHFYTDHYNFPNRSWDNRDWRIRDSSTTGSGLAVYLNLAFSRQAGRPFTVSEYNQNWPNTHASEIDPTLAVFGAFQDWDSIMHFAYAHSRDWDARTPGGFDLKSDWTKWPNFGQSAWLFRSGAIRMGAKPVHIPAPEPLRYQQAREKYGRRVAPFLEKAAGADPLIALRHRVALDIHATGKLGPLPPSAPDFTYRPKDRVFLLHAPQAAGVFGFFPAARSLSAGPLTVELAPATRDFATVLLTSLDGQPIEQSKRLLLSIPGMTLRSHPGAPPRPQKLVNYPGAAGWWTLEPDEEFKDRPSGSNGTGAPPAWMERVESFVTLATKAARIEVYPLDGAGARMKALTAVRKSPGGFRIHLQADGQDFAPWYELAAP
jgi:hypothetical protein